MDIYCDKIVEKYLLNQNPFYTFSFPIAILISIVVFGLCQASKWSENSYINQILLPVATLLFVMVIIDIFSRAMISQSEKDRLTKLCKLWMHNPVFKNNPMKENLIDMDFIANYDGSIEHFQENGNEQSVDELAVNPLAPKDVNMTEGKEILDTSKSSMFKTIAMKISGDNKNITSSDIPMKMESPDAFDENLPYIPAPIPFKNFGKDGMCIQPSNCCSLCSGSNSNPCDIVSPIPGPAWIPQTASEVQKRLYNNDYTQNNCKITH